MYISYYSCISKKYNAVNGSAVAQNRSLQGVAPRDRSAAGRLRGLGFGPKDVGEVGLSRRGHCGLEKLSMNREVRFSKFL